MVGCSALSMLTSRILFIAQFLDDLADSGRSQILEVAISDLHSGSGAARAQTLSNIPTKQAVRSNLARVDFELVLDFVNAWIGSHQPTAYVAANLQMVLARRPLVQHRVEGGDAKHVRRRVTHQPADIFRDLLRDPAKLALRQGQHGHQSRALLRIMAQERLVTALACFT